MAQVMTRRGSGHSDNFLSGESQLFVVEASRDHNKML